MSRKPKQLTVEVDSDELSLDPPDELSLDSSSISPYKSERAEANGNGGVKRYRRRPGPKGNQPRIGRPPKGSAALRPPEEEGEGDEWTGTEVLTPDSIIGVDRLKLLEDLKRKKGESAMDYLDRVSPYLVQELVMMAMSTVKAIHPRIKLDIIKELLQRPLPVKTTLDVNTTISEVDRMSDEEVYERLKSEMQELKASGMLPEPLKEIH